MSKTFYKCVEKLNDEFETIPITNSIPASIAYGIAQFCGYHEEGVPILFTKKDLPKLREYYRQVRSNPSEFAIATTTIGQSLRERVLSPASFARVTYCGNDADYILDVVAKVGKTLHSNEVLVI